MFLKRFVYVNWGNIPSLEFEFGPVNLFSGGNGSGKTTAADAIQTIMTAAHENLFHYNPGQDESTQRGRGGKRVRTLESYVLGCDDGSYARLDPTDGYLAAVFHPTEGESGEPFTALIAVRAWLEHNGAHKVARQDAAQYLIVRAEQLWLSHFVQSDNGQKQVLSLAQLEHRLIAEFGQHQVERYDTKKGYLRRLYGALRGKPESVSELEAVAAARAFSRFMAYKPVKGINKFVADEILEQKDLGEAVRSVSSQLKTIHHMERDAAQLAESVQTLQRGNALVAAYIDQWVSAQVLDYSLAQAQYQRRQHDYLQKKSAQTEQQKELQRCRLELDHNATQSALVHDELVSLEARRQGIDALRQKDELEQRRERLNQRIAPLGLKLLEQDGLLSANVESTRQIQRCLQLPELMQALPKAASLQNRALAQSLIASAELQLKDIARLMQRDMDGVSAALEQYLDAAARLQALHAQWFALWHQSEQGSVLRQELGEFEYQRKARQLALTEQRNHKRQEIERLAANQVTYPPYVEKALKAIRAAAPAADPRVLCDYVEVRDARWQAAIEGYMGGNRFAILVQQEYEAEAIRIVRSMPGRDNRAKVIQGEKARQDAERTQLEKDSIVHVLEFSHAAARAFVMGNYANVRRVASVQELRFVRRGLTEDGMGSGGYSLFRCDLPESELVFGAAARERALHAKQQELERIEQDWQAASELQIQVTALLKAVDALRDSRYAEALAEVVNTQSELGKTERSLQQLDLKAFDDLEQEQAILRQRREAMSQRSAELNRMVGESSEKLRELERELKHLSDDKDALLLQLETREQALQAITPVWPDFNPAVRLEQADSDARSLNIETARLQREAQEQELHRIERKLGDAIQGHNQLCRPGDAIILPLFNGQHDAAYFKAVCALQRDLDRVFNLLQNNILVQRRQQLGELKAAFNNAFVTHLCHAIYQALNDSKRQIDQLNRELQHHRFGADRETFRFAAEWVPEFRDYSRFFEEVVKTPTLSDEVTLFDAQLSARSQSVLKDMMRMLLDDDEQRAMRELDRIADYRNYRRYEIFKEVQGKQPIPLSEYGTGSGGQLETPAYIIRAAAITSAFRFAEGDTHLRMVLVDEAFSKMDETRSREVINYLTQSLGLQLMFIMPTSKCGPFMDMISNEFVFAKVPSAQPRGELATRVLVDRKTCNQDSIRALWANHRRIIYHQAELDFMQAFNVTESASH